MGGLWDPGHGPSASMGTGGHTDVPEKGGWKTEANTALGERVIFPRLGVSMVVLQLGHEPVWPQFSQYGQRSLVSVLRLRRSCGLGSQAKAGKAAGLGRWMALCHRGCFADVICYRAACGDLAAGSHPPCA